MTSSPTGVADLLADAGTSDRTTLNEIVPGLYQELRRLAKHQMRRQRRGHTLRTTDLVNEAYLRLAKLQHIPWSNRAQFLAVASRAMRCVLVDYFRRRRRAKRGGNPARIPLDEAMIVSEQRATEIIELDQALSKLGAIDPRKSQIVELRYFGGLSVEETAKVVGAAPITVKREWARARAWLYDELRQGGGK